MDAQENTSLTVTNSGPASATTSFVASVTEQKQFVAVPTAKERSMPPQALGELPDVRPAMLWNSFTQNLWRSTYTLVSSVFARGK